MQKAGHVLGQCYTILGIYHGFDPQLNLEFQLELVYDKFEWYWDFYEMILDYYTKYLDPGLKIIKRKLDRDYGGGKWPAMQEEVESSNECDNDLSSFLLGLFLYD